MGPRRKEQGAGPQPAVSETAGQTGQAGQIRIVRAGGRRHPDPVHADEPHPTACTGADVDFNPAGKQAAWKLTDSWLTDGKPLGMNPSIVSWMAVRSTRSPDRRARSRASTTSSPYAPTWLVDGRHGGEEAWRRLIGSPSVKTSRRTAEKRDERRHEHGVGGHVGPYGGFRGAGPPVRAVGAGVGGFRRGPADHADEGSGSDAVYTPLRLGGATWCRPASPPT